MISFGFPKLSFGPSPTILPASIAVEAPKPASGGIAEIFKPKPSGGNVDLSGALAGAGSGAATGAAISGGNPIGAAIGAGVGILDGLFGNKKGAGAATGSGGGLSDAFAAGLSAIGLGGKQQPVNVTQSQSVTQGTSVNVSNILGGKAFGGVDETGNFDTFQAISDVFAIKSAMDASQAGGGEWVAGSAAEIVPTKSSSNLTPLLLIAAGGGLLWLIFGGKK